MSIFSTILAKLGFGKEAQAQAAAPSTPAQTQASATAPSGTAAPPAPAAISVVDVVARLETMAGAHGEKLNWKTSIVDLLKLLDLDSSLAARKELATELGCPAERMGDWRSHEHLAAQDRAEEAGRERRQHSGGPARLSVPSRHILSRLSRMMYLKRPIHSGWPLPSA